MKGSRLRRWRAEVGFILDAFQLRRPRGGEWTAIGVFVVVVALWVLTLVEAR